MDVLGFSQGLKVLSHQLVALSVTRHERIPYMVLSLIFVQTQEKCKRKEEVGRRTGEDESSGSVSHVVAQEDDVVCDDGRGLTSDLVLVHVLSIIQFPLHEDPGPFLDVLVGDVSQTGFEHGHAMPRRLLTDVTCCARLAVSRAPHFVGRQGEDGDRVPPLHLSHHGVLTDSA